MQDRVPPQNIEAEQSVLGAMLIDNTAAISVTEMLLPEDFYRESHKIIYRAMLSLLAKNEPLDMITLINELKKMNKLDDVDGVAYITLLANFVPTAVNVKYHAKIVEEKSILRQLVEGGTAIAYMGYEGTGEATDILDKAEKRILNISNRRGGIDFSLIKDVLPNTLDRISKALDNKEPITGLATGFKDLDYLTAGMQPADFIILALNIAQNVAIRGSRNGEPKKTVAFFSFEMSEELLVQRMLCAEAEVDSQRLRVGGEIKDEEDNSNLWNRLWIATDRLAEAQIFIDHNSDATVMNVRSKARRLKAEKGLDLIIIDYLQMMRGTGRNNSDNRQQEVSEISRGLKALARELAIPVIALSQLSRNVESRTVKRPILSDLRESGSLEQDADIVMFLYREDYYKAQDEEHTYVTELNIAKHRNGPTGMVPLFFHEKYTKFISLSRRPEDGGRKD